jgi:beta-glucosidase/6-phospho-beta-glucosidase/beta-galactosidase
MARNVAEDVFRQREASTVGERISLKYPDYADIVTKENIELAEQLEPELAEAIGKMDDPYKQRVTAYKLLKRVAHKGEVGNSMEKKKAMANSQKPLSVNAVTKQSAIGNAHLFENGLTAELKKQLWKEMRDAAKAS